MSKPLHFFDTFLCIDFWVISWLLHRFRTIEKARSLRRACSSCPILMGMGRKHPKKHMFYRRTWHLSWFNWLHQWLDQSQVASHIVIVYIMSYQCFSGENPVETISFPTYYPDPECMWHGENQSQPIWRWSMLIPVAPSLWKGDRRIGPIHPNMNGHHISH